MGGRSPPAVVGGCASGWVVPCDRFVLPLSLNIINGTSAYVFGTIFGKTRVSATSNKTFEGFACAAPITLLVGFLLPAVLCKYDYLICPKDYVSSHVTTTRVTIASAIGATAMATAPGIAAGAATSVVAMGSSRRQACWATRSLRQQPLPLLLREP